MKTDNIFPNNKLMLMMMDNDYEEGVAFFKFGKVNHYSSGEKVQFATIRWQGNHFDDRYWMIDNSAFVRNDLRVKSVK